MNQEEREDKLTCQIIDILKYQQVITNQGIFYMGEKDWALNKIKNLIQSEVNIALANRNKELANAMKDYDVTCPKAYGFEGKDTYPDCGKCIVCELLSLITKDNE